jgi:hypothetical protein
MTRPSAFAQAIKMLVVALILLTSFLPASQPAEAAVDVAWNMHCLVSHTSRDDPIVFPGRSGAAHQHTFVGNRSTDANTTTDSLLKNSSTCQRGFQNTDRSAYWVPALYKKQADGSLKEVRGNDKEQNSTIYYRRNGGATGDKVSPIPQGLRMIAGDAKATAPTKQLNTAYRCRGLEQNFVGPSTAHIPDCTSGQFIQALVRFPDCWDGKNLDSPDHQSHMAYSSGKQKSCPQTHPVKVPKITFEMQYKNATGKGSQYVLSSGGQYSLHADFFAAWDQKVQSALINSCLNVGKKCTGIKLSEVNLSAASKDAATAKRLPEPAVAGAATHSGHKPAAAAATTPHPAHTPHMTETKAASLPAAGPVAGLGAVAGIGAMGYAFRSFRLRRRALRDALRSRKP